LVFITLSWAKISVEWIEKKNRICKNFIKANILYISNLQKLYICSMKKFSLILCLIILCACDNEIDINDEWRDIPVIYAVFDLGSITEGDGNNVDFGTISYPSGIYDTIFDSDGDIDNNDINLTHFVRVQKSFLGPLSADSYVDVYDSIYYNPDHLSVWIDLIDAETGEIININDTEYLEHIPANQIDPEHPVFKEDGYFNSEHHYLFKYVGVSEEEEDMPRKYRVSVLSNATGEIASAETNIVQPLDIKRPKAVGPTSVLRLGDDGDVPIMIKPSKNAKMYSITLRFHYLEQAKNDYETDRNNGLGEPDNFIPTTEVSQKYIEWTLFQEVIEDIDQLNGSNLANDIVTSFSGTSFFTHLKSQISEQNLTDPEYYRYPRYSFYQESEDDFTNIDAGFYHRCIDIEISAINTELYTYLNANLPNYGINQERPDYNNVNNGLGHVSSRSILKLTNLRIDNDANDALSFGEITQKLNFACYKDNSDIYTVKFWPDCD